MTANKLLNELTRELNEISLPHMAETLNKVYHSGQYDQLDHLSLLQEIVEPEYTAKLGNRIENRLVKAHLKGCPQEIANCVNSAQREYQPSRITDTLRTLDFVDQRLNVCILGPSDSGKSYLAKALGILACSQFSVEYHHSETLLEMLASLKSTSYEKYQKRIRLLIKRDLLILDDFLLHTITDEREVKILFEILEKRSELRSSTIVCSQREPKSWTSMIYNNEVAANALMKRITKHYTVVITPR